MPDRMIPPGYRAIFLGSAASIEDLNTLVPLEEGVAEGALMLMRLDLADYPSSEALDELNRNCLDAGIPPWPGYDYIVYADTTRPSIYLAWQKGIAWLAIIGGILAVPFVGSLLWWIIPEEIKTTITSVINMGMMLVIMFVMMQVIRPLMASAREKPRKLRETPERVKEMEEAEVYA